LLDQPFGLPDERAVDCDTHALPGFTVIDNALLNGIPVFAQHDRLHGKLCPVRRPEFEPKFALAGIAVLVVDGRDRFAIGLYQVRLHQVHLRDDAQPFAGERDGPCVDVLRNLARRGKRGSLGVHAPVLDRAFDGIDALLEHAFHPFVEEKARTVSELVNHPRGQIVR
jgi:hypothetical protein